MTEKKTDEKNTHAHTHCASHSCTIHWKYTQTSFHLWNELKRICDSKRLRHSRECERICLSRLACARTQCSFACLLLCAVIVIDSVDSNSITTVRLLYVHTNIQFNFIHKTNRTVGSCLSSSQNVISIRCGLLLLAFYKTSEFYPKRKKK